MVCFVVVMNRTVKLPYNLVMMCESQHSVTLSLRIT